MGVSRSMKKSDLLFLISFLVKYDMMKQGSKFVEFTRKGELHENCHGFKKCRFKKEKYDSC